MRRGGGGKGDGVYPRPAGGDGAPYVSQSGYGWRGGVRPRSYRGTRPRFASGTLMSLRTIPPFRAGVLCGCGRVFRVAALDPAAGACRCTFRKRHQGTLSGALRSEARRERSAREGGFPCRSVGRCAPAASRRNANDAFLKRFSVRSYPAAHSREREPNAPRSAPPPASNQRQRQPQRCRCAPPARAPPNRQCR